MTIRKKAAHLLAVAASAGEHTAVDFLAAELGYGRKVVERATHAVAVVTTNKPVDLVSGDWWRDILAGAAQLLEEDLA